MPKVELDPKTRPAESITLGTAVSLSINEFFAAHWASGAKLIITGLAPYAVTWALVKLGKYRPKTQGEVEL